MAGRVISLSQDALHQAIGCTRYTAARWAVPLDAACVKYAINTPARMAAFIAQIAHESGCLIYVRELWGPTPAQQRYEGRRDLGNTMAGDGFKYRGRGLIQITGRANYRRLSQALGVGFESAPELLEQPAWAAESAAWYWTEHGLNELADRETELAFKQITKKINGGLNGYAQRLALWERAKEVLQ